MNHCTYHNRQVLCTFAGFFFVIVGLRLLWTKEKRSGKDTGGASRRLESVFSSTTANRWSPVTGELGSMRIRDIENKTNLSFGVVRAAHCCSCPNDQGSFSGGYFRWRRGRGRLWVNDKLQRLCAYVQPPVCDSVPLRSNPSLPCYPFVSPFVHTYISQSPICTILHANKS